MQGYGLILFMFFTVTVSAFGQLGNTPQDCERRYGPAVSEKSDDGGGGFLREYRTSQAIITIRFLTYTIGSTGAGWVRYTPVRSDQDSAALRKQFREAAVKSWDPLEDTAITASMPPGEVLRAQASNRIVADRRALIRKVTGWKDARCWSSPSAYAADNGVSVILFSDVYCARCDGARP